jgi:hypothetical protein
MRGISGGAEDLLAFQEGLFSMELGGPGIQVDNNDSSFCILNG